MTSQTNASERPDKAIAIIGMACIFPGARNAGEFWRNILNGVDAVSDPPERAWDPAVYYDPTSTATDRVYTKRGGYIEDYATFDPLPFGVPPKDVGGEPDQWLALKLAREALLDAGYADAPEAIRRRTGVVLGRGLYPNSGSVNAVQHTLIVTQTLDVIRQLQPDLTEQELEAIRTQLRDSLPKFGADTSPALTPNMITGRIANRLDLMGPNYTVDAACASSLVAMKMASRELLMGECDMALAGGSQLWTCMPILGVFGQMGALSRSEQIKPFDKDADGTLLSEGVAFVVLKRLADAERDKDRIYAVIRGIGVSSDGRASGLMAPRVEGQVLAMRRAYDDAGVEPETIGLIEAHGTGTPVGDAAEIESMTAVFGNRRGALPDVPVGSVKSMIGHALPAAGTAGLIKAALSLYHRVLPPSLHCDEPNPELGLENTPFFINNTTRPWISGHEHPRRAAVSAFGFGGINGHVVLEEYVPSAPVPDEELPQAVVGDVRTYLPEWENELCVVTGATREELAANVAALAARLAASEASAPSLLAVAHALAGDAVPEHQHRLSIVAGSLEDLREKANRAAERLADPACTRIREASGVYYTSQPLGREGKVAFLFPGEGSQYAGMLSQLALHFPEARSAFDEMDTFHIAGSNTAPSTSLFPPPQATEAERAAANAYLWTMEGAVTGVLASDEAMLRVLKSLGVRPDAVAGHSSGEYAALRTAGVFDNAGRDDFGTLARILLGVHDASMRDDAIQPAVLLACGTDRETAEAMLRQTGAEGFVAMDNCPNQVVIVAQESAREALVSAAREQAVIVEVLNFDRPYHTPWFSAYSERMRSALQAVSLSAPNTTAYSCATAAVVGTDVDALQSLVAGQWSEAVEFRRLVENLYEDGFRVFIEVGPGNHLTAFVEDILRGKRIAALASNVQQRSDLTQLNHLAGQLFAQGVDIRVGALTEHRNVPETTTKPSLTEVQLVTGFTPMKLDASKIAAVRKEAPATAENRPIEAPADGPAGANERHASAASQDAIAAEAASPEGARTLSSQNPPPITPFTQHPPAGQDQLAAVTHRFLETMDHFLAVQERVLLAYLNAGGDAPAEAALAPAPVAAWLPPAPPAYTNGAYSNGHANGQSPAPTYPVEVTRPALVAGTSEPSPPVSAAPPPATVYSANGHGNGSTPAASPAPIETAAAASVATAAPASSVPLIEQLRQIVSDRTGYPAEVIDANADLEADLGIDSIKRVEILGTLRSQDASLQNVDLERLTVCRTLQQIMDVLSGEAGGGPFEFPSVDEPGPSTEGHTKTQPAFGQLTEFEPGRLVVRRLHVNPEEASWLRDHTIGREVSFQDPGLRALPVMPLTLTLELLAQAATEAMPGLVVTRMEDVRARRWIEFGDGPQTIELRAERAEDGQPRFHCQAAVVQGETAVIAVEADVLLEPAYPARPPAPEAPAAEAPSGFEPGDLYQAVLYHGDTWQGVIALHRTGTASISGPVVAGRQIALRDGDSAMEHLTDPVALDAAGQLVGLWTAEHFEAGRLVFPISVRSIEFFGPPARPGEGLTAQAAISKADDLLVEADISLIGESGMQARLNGWLDRRFHLPLAIEPVIRPRALPWLAEEVDPSILGPAPDSEALCLRMEADMEDETGLLRRVWASRIRSGAERERLGLSVESIAALAREHLAKEATCRLVHRLTGASLLPADISLDEISEAELHPVGTSLSSLGVSPDVWLAQAGNTLIAVAGVTRTDAGARRHFAAELALKAHEAEDSHVV